jgi:hypothetical protein
MSAASRASTGIMRKLRGDTSFRAQVAMLDAMELPWELCPPVGTGHPYLLIRGFRWPVACSGHPRARPERVKASLRRWLREHNLDPGSNDFAH